MLIRSLLLLFFSGFFILACQQGGSAPAASVNPDVKFASNATFALQTQVVLDCSLGSSTILNGGTITTFQNSSVLFGQSCISEVRTCNNGILSGSYNYESCAVAAPASCLFNGQTVAHGASIEAYPNSSVGLGAECIFEMRTCNNGVLSGSNQFASCSIYLPASCLFNGQTIADGQSVNAFLSSSVPAGQQCSVEARYCVNGALSGSNQFASCVVDKPASCLFNGQTIADGQSINAFLNSTAPFGGSCMSESRTCSNGVLSGINQFANCVVDSPASCLFNGQTIAHNSSVTAYLTSNTGTGELCTAEERFCDNGQLAGSYQFASCVIDQAASCLFNGQTVADGTSVTAFISSSVNTGETCTSEIRVCTSGSLSGSATFASCQVNSSASCLFNGQTILDGQNFVGYQSSQVPHGQLCTSETKTCNNGVISGEFTFASCTVQVSEEEDREDKNKEKYCRIEHVEKKHYGDDNDDKNKNENKDPNGKNENDKLGDHSDNGLHLGWYKEKHKDHYDCGKHLGWYKDKKQKKNTCSGKDDKKEKKK